MPTRDNVAHLEALIDATTHLVETKRLADKADYDIMVLKKRLEIREDEEEGGPKMEGASGGDAMEVDDSQTGADAEGETEDDTGRAGSVVSARSINGVGRGNRKHVSKCLGENLG